MGAIRWGLEKIIHSLGYQVIRDSKFTFPDSGFTKNRTNIPKINNLPDGELKILNEMLPWASYVIDSQGRRFGKPFSTKKRNLAEVIPDPRIIDLNTKIPLTNLTVLEVGCFEGNHTCTLCQLADKVIAIDSRIEHVVKTIVRCAMFGQKPDVFCIDLEKELPHEVNLECDILHHIGVLYHLTDPVSHLIEMSKLTRQAILLDTHIAPAGEPLKSYTAGGKEYQYYRFSESGRSGPFAGMHDHAKWLVKDELISLLNCIGFGDVDVIELREERNGPRIQLLARRGSA